MTEKASKVFHKRKKLNLKVKHDFQIWLLIRIMGSVFLTICLASIILYFYALTVVDTDYLRFAPEIRKVSDVLLPVLLAAALTSIVAGLLLALFLPQKIAGPIYRIEQDLEQIRNGDLTKVITLRYADVLKELAHSVNMTVEEIRNLINEVKKTGSDLEASINEEDSEGIKTAIKKQKECLGKIIT